MRKHARISRRGLLQGTAASMLAVPFLRSLTSAAQDSPHRKRFVVFFSPNEPIDRDHWLPNGAGSEFALPAALPAMLEPLEPFRDDLLMLGNLELATRQKDSFGGGHVGMGHMLTGEVNIPYGTANNEFWAGGISVDQFIAQALGVDALTLKAGSGGSNGQGRMSYLGANQPVHPHEDPMAVFQQLFGDFQLPPDELKEIRAQQSNVLDFVASDVARVRSQLPSEDREKMDAHLSAVEGLQAKLQGDLTLACNEPAEPMVGNGYDYKSNANYPQTSRLLMDVMVEALACEVTDVATLQLGSSGSAGTAAWADEGVDFNLNEHTIAHDYIDDPTGAKRQRREALELFYFRQFAYLLEQLDARPEGDGTLLDNTLVFWLKNLGYRHRSQEMLFMLAGGKAHGLQTGLYRSYPGASHNDLLVTLCNLMGLHDVSSFGDSELCTGPLF
jgi:hypothetical protein